MKRYNIHFDPDDIPLQESENGLWVPYSDVIPLEARIRELEEEVRIDNQLLSERDRLVKAIPECPPHGLCIPHAVVWIDEAKQLKVENAQLRKELDSKP